MTQQLEDPQREWLMLSRSINARPIHLLRTTPVHNTLRMCEEHDAVVKLGLTHILPAMGQIAASDNDREFLEQQIQAPAAMGGLGLPTAMRRREAAYVASVTDSLETIQRYLGAQGLQTMAPHFPNCVPGYDVAKNIFASFIRQPRRA